MNDWLSDHEVWLSALTWAAFLLLLLSRKRRRLRLPALACLAVAWLVPPELHTAPAPATKLDEAMPRYHFQEWHYRHIRAPQHIVYRALRASSILTLATRLQFRIIEESEGCEIVLGRPVFAGAEAAINFLLEPTSRGSTVLSTETRVHSASPIRAQAFAAYWRTIYPGSALLRFALLRTIESSTARN